MTTHVSARIAWHMDGWNGRICRNPAANTYCVGPNTYPNRTIPARRDLIWEQSVAGQTCSALSGIPPCSYSINAFGTDEIMADANPPEFFNTEATRTTWPMPPSTVAIWPFEEMYQREGVERPTGGYDYDKRLEYAKAFFSELVPDRSLIFYYANYSNPLSEEDQQRYILVGLARIKSHGPLQYFENTSEDIKRRYAGGAIWAYNVTSHYPDQGLRIPYHLYLDYPDVLEQIALVPHNPRVCKYASRHVSDDDALDLVEQFLRAATALRDIGDTSENWPARIAWLESLIAELWDSRGLYPGLPTVLDVIGFSSAVPYFKSEMLAGREQAVRDAIFTFLDGRADSLPGLSLAAGVAKDIRKKWMLREEDQQRLLRDVLPRFDLTREQIERVVSAERSKYSLYATATEIADNPYLLCEGYIGDGPDDTIPFNKIDHGMFPSPELGGTFWVDPDNWRRLRALCVEQLKGESQHTFMLAPQIIQQINHRLNFMPPWKRVQFTDRYLIVYEEEQSGALAYRREGDRLYLYLKSVFDDEREVEKQLRFLANGPDIAFRTPITASHWRDFLYNPASPLARSAGDQYETAIREQAAVCAKIFVRPVCVLSGGAGTGKTTIIKALIKAIERAHGTGTSFNLLAPTGKAADRIRHATGKDASTVHSFLARLGWLNDNMTFKRTGGKHEGGTATYIIDEASMLDLELAATLFRAIDWRTVQRLILVGDPNQLPPIGRGRVFADVIDWFADGRTESIGELAINMRQMVNQIEGKGNSILDLASLYIRRAGESEISPEAEEMLRRAQEGGEVDKDLRVLYWQNTDELADLLTRTIIADMEADTGQTLDPDKPWGLWNAAFSGKEKYKQPEYQQVISPYRGELFGVDALNLLIQERSRGRKPDFHRTVDGIAIGDKVLQIRNRGRSRGIWSYNTEARQSEQVEVFNGELGFVKPHAFDGKKLSWPAFRVQRFQVVFSGAKQKYWVGYGREAGTTTKGYRVHEPVLDNLELAYAISVHKAQGSEFERVYFVVPRNKTALLSPELFYTGLTRAKRHCTLLVEEDVRALVSLARPEKSHLARINSSLFTFRPVPDALQDFSWYEEGKIHQTLTEFMVRSKSEVIIANLLFDRDIPFHYELPLFAPNGTFYLPDFTINWRGQLYFWEHLGRLDLERYRNHWETKRAWYERHFPGQVVTTIEGGDLTAQAIALIERAFR